MHSFPHAIRRVLKSILCVCRLGMNVFPLTSLCRYVKLYFANSFSVRLNVVLVPCYSSCVNFNLVHTECLGLDPFSFGCCLWCATITFVHTCIVTLNMFLVPCHFACVKLDFHHNCHLELDVLHLPCNSRWLKLKFLLTYILKLHWFSIICHSRFSKLTQMDTSLSMHHRFHVELPRGNLSRFHWFWKKNPRGNYDIDSTWKFQHGFDFQNRRNINAFPTWIFLCCLDVEST